MASRFLKQALTDPAGALAELKLELSLTKGFIKETQSETEIAKARAHRRALKHAKTQIECWKESLEKSEGRAKTTVLVRTTRPPSVLQFRKLLADTMKHTVGGPNYIKKRNLTALAVVRALDRIKCKENFSKAVMDAKLPAEDEAFFLFLLS